MQPARTCLGRSLSFLRAFEEAAPGLLALQQLIVNKGHLINRIPMASPFAGSPHRLHGSAAGTSTSRSSAPGSLPAAPRVGPKMQRRLPYFMQQPQLRQQQQQIQQQQFLTPTAQRGTTQQQQQQRLTSPYSGLRRGKRLPGAAAPNSVPQHHAQQQQQQQQHQLLPSASSAPPAAAAPAAPAQPTQPQFASPYAAIRHAKQQRQLARAAAALNSTSPQPNASPRHASPTGNSSRTHVNTAAGAAAAWQQQHQQHMHVSSRLLSPGAFVVAASAAAAAADLEGFDGEGFVPSLAGWLGDGRSSSSSMQPQQAPGAQAPRHTQHQQQQQRQQSSSHIPPWHIYSSSSSSSSHAHHLHLLGHHQQQQQRQREALLPQLLQLSDSSSGPAVVDITHLLALQQQEDQEAADAAGSTTSSTSSSSDRPWRKLSLEQQQLRLLESAYGQQQQLLWVTVHQPAGGRGPAAVWVKPWCCCLNPEQLHVSSGPDGAAHIVLQLPQRPDLGQAPAAVVEGLQFSPSTPAAAAAAGAAAAGAAEEADTSSSSSSSSAGRVFDYLLVSSGDFSTEEHSNMFPNAVVHCGDGRQLHCARGAHDLAVFAADADLGNVRSHCENLIRMAWERREGPGRDLAWVYAQLQRRWGLGALLRLGVNPGFVTECLYAVKGVPRPQQQQQHRELVAPLAPQSTKAPATVAAAATAAAAAGWGAGAAGLGAVHQGVGGVAGRAGGGVSDLLLAAFAT